MCCLHCCACCCFTQYQEKGMGDLTKRVYLANILYTLLYSIAAIAAVNYCRPPSQESTWCETKGFVLQYSGTLVIVHYLALALTAAFQVTLSVYQAVTKRKDSFKKANFKLGEVFLYLILFLCLLLNSWEPFLPQLPSYGNYRPVCWFHLELTDNCTYNTLNERFLQAIPFAVVHELLILCVNLHHSAFSVWHVLQVSHNNNWRSHNQDPPNNCSN